MSDSVQRTASILVGAAVVLVLGWITADQFGKSHPHIEADAGLADASMAVDAASPTASAAAPATLASALPVSDAGGPTEMALSPLFLDAGTPMPQGAPRTVRLGVVLVQFEGAEGASSSARSKKDALEQATKLLETARTDFKQAVKSGDGGSSDDIGRIPRGVLDPRTEVSVFSMSAGDVSDVLETPRGYWIVKRID